MLHELEIGEKNLVVKVDAKTKLVLDTYKGINIVGYSFRILLTSPLYQLTKSRLQVEAQPTEMTSSSHRNNESKTNGSRNESGRPSRTTSRKCKQIKPEVVKLVFSLSNKDHLEISISLQPRRRKEENRKRKRPEQPKRRRPTVWI